MQCRIPVGKNTCTSLSLPTLQDRYAERQALPTIDPSQDWFLVSGEEAGGYTILEFTRNWTTCDERDRDIVVSCYTDDVIRKMCEFVLMLA